MADRKFGKFSKGRDRFVGEVKGDRVIELREACMMDVIENGARTTSHKHDLEKLRVLAPVDRPSKIICIGLNYRSHIREMNWEMPKVPIIFTKPSSAIIGPGEAIELPTISKRVDYEGESAVIIGKRARRARDGWRHIFGYTCFNDVTARDLQKSDVDWTRAKGFDTFAPVGPFISTKAPTRVVTRLNGKIVQSAPLLDRVFDDAALVEYISSIMTLDPGDIIATGTPSGISPMKHGDVVEVELDGVGILKNKVINAR
ncbi:MAG: fumarylacetoacetate hydrolase family protein [Thermoplasmata archaeon]